MSTTFYKIAHQVLPSQVAKKPSEVWDSLSGPDWSTWLAMVGQALGEPVRGVGVEGVLTGNAVQSREGVEMLAVYFPKPEAPGEPFFAVLARSAGTTQLRSFVFELGISEPGEPLRVVMAEWRTSGDSVMRLRFDVADDASLDTCLRRTVEIMKEDGSLGNAPAAALPPFAPMKTNDDKSSAAGIAVAVFAVLFVVALAVFFFLA